MTRFSGAQSALVGAAIFVSVTPLLGGQWRLAGYVALGAAALLLREGKPALVGSVPLVFTVAAMSFGFVGDLTFPGGGLGHALGTNALFLAGLTAGWLLAAAVPAERMLPLLGSWAVFFAALSLVGVAIYTFAPGVVSSLPTYTFGSTHHTIGIANILTQEGRVLQRNAGIASEPGLFQLVLNLGAAAYLRAPDRVPSARWYLGLAVIGVAVFATRSTAGLVIFGLLTAWGALRSTNVRMFAAGVAVLGGGALVREWVYQREHKLQGSAAFESRLAPSLEVLTDALQAPLGVGTAAYNAGYGQSGWGSYDGLTQILIRFGIPLAVILFTLLVRNLPREPFPVLVVLLTLLSQPTWAVPLVAYFYYWRPVRAVTARGVGRAELENRQGTGPPDGPGQSNIQEVRGG